MKKSVIGFLSLLLLIGFLGCSNGSDKDEGFVGTWEMVVVDAEAGETSTSVLTLEESTFDRSLSAVETGSGTELERYRQRGPLAAGESTFSFTIADMYDFNSSQWIEVTGDMVIANYSASYNEGLPPEEQLTVGEFLALAYQNAVSGTDWFDVYTDGMTAEQYEAALEAAVITESGTYTIEEDTLTLTMDGDDAEVYTRVE